MIWRKMTLATHATKMISVAIAALALSAKIFLVAMAKKLKKDSKAYAQRVHAIKRLADPERYNLIISEDEYHQLCNYIKKGLTKYPDGTEVQHLATQSGRVTIWGIKWPKCDKPLIAVYDKERKQIASFLPPGATVEEKLLKGEIDEVN